jgi:transposase
MRVWLKQLKVSEIAMELLLVNPAQVRALNGRKSDGRDAQRIAEYLQDGRLDGSFAPPAEVCQLQHDASAPDLIARTAQRNPQPHPRSFRDGEHQAVFGC